MKFTRLKSLIGLLIIVITLIVGLLGCVNQVISTPYQTPASESSLQSTLEIFKTPTVASSATPTYTPLPTMTFTPLPTLELTQAQDTLQQLLMKQPPCQSPCFWGITPNQTPVNEAQNIFNQLSISLLHMSQNGTKNYYAADFGLQNGLSIVVALKAQNDLVDSIRTNIGFANYESSLNQREWVAFSPETILAQYGLPTRVEFHVAAPACGSSPCKIFYKMIMYFDSSNLVVEYDSKLINDQKTIRVCPLIDEYDGVRVWLGKNADYVPTKQGASLEDATSLTIEQFYKLMLQESQTACFDLSPDAVMQKP